MQTFHYLQNTDVNSCVYLHVPCVYLACTCVHLLHHFDKNVRPAAWISFVISVSSILTRLLDFLVDIFFSDIPTNKKWREKCSCDVPSRSTSRNNEIYFAGNNANRCKNYNSVSYGVMLISVLLETVIIWIIIIIIQQSQVAVVRFPWFS